MHFRVADVCGLKRSWSWSESTRSPDAFMILVWIASCAMRCRQTGCCVTPALRAVSISFERLCSKRMPVAMPERSLISALETTS
jgi:hypothetical protein